MDYFKVLEIGLVSFQLMCRLATAYLTILATSVVILVNIVILYQVRAESYC